MNFLLTVFCGFVTGVGIGAGGGFFCRYIDPTYPTVLIIIVSALVGIVAGGFIFIGR